MPASRPSLAELPGEIPVFPLGEALLLPAGRLPLNIFEPRYLALVSDSLGAGRVFGMIQPDPQRPPGETGPALCRVGCLGRLTSFSETDDGRFLITLTGLIRFAVAEELPLHRGYRRVRPDYAAFAADLEPAPAVIDRAALVKALRPYFKARGMDANWQAVEQTSDELLVTTLSMVCPFDPREKQALLEAATGSDRAALLTALLEMGAMAGVHGGPDPASRPS